MASSKDRIPTLDGQHKGGSKDVPHSAHAPTADVSLERPGDSEQPPSTEAGIVSVTKHEVTDTCSVCFEQLPSTAFPDRPPADACNHKPNVCSACLRQHIDARIDGWGTQPMPCPVPICPESLGYDDMMLFASPEAFMRYDDLLIRKHLGESRDFVFCKNPQCGAGQFHARRSVFANVFGRGRCSDPRDLVTCFACGSMSCFRHEVPWHEGLTCSEYSRRMSREHVEAELASYVNVKGTTKPCPKCQVPITKIGGCDHMRCKSPGGCGHAFRWSQAKSNRHIFVLDFARMLLMRWWIRRTGASGATRTARLATM